MPISLHSGIAEIAPRYDAFLLDIWGVLWDGEQAYPHARDCLARLKDAGKRTLLLSNAPRRAAIVAERLAGIGITPDLYGDLISSGEASREALTPPASLTLPVSSVLADFDFGDRRYLFMGADADRSLLHGLDYRCVETAAEADFVLNCGITSDDDTLDRFMPLLRAARARALPMICANPDLVIVRANGRRVLCAGATAAAYEEMGGRVAYFGKPHRPIYEACFARLAGIARDRIVAVGDNLDTDITGARAVGLDTVLVLGGVLADSVGLGAGGTPDVTRIEAVCADHGAVPAMAVPVFAWT